jgi:DNA-directed RNA polymerase subunit M/transcription elongation factor TFIIS
MAMPDTHGDALSLVCGYFGVLPDVELSHLLQSGNPDGVSVREMLFCASYFSAYSKQAVYWNTLHVIDFLTHLRSVGGSIDGQRLPGVFSVAIHEWDQYCAYVETQIQGNDGDYNTSVFGVCRRCGSSRLFVTTRQLRRADEGMTEIRLCKNCGHVTKVNS